MDEAALSRLVGAPVVDGLVGTSSISPTGWAHSTHVKGQGRYDPATGVETPRVTVTLATGISPELCRKLNLGYRDPASIDVAARSKRDGVMVVARAGEMLYRLRAN